MIVVVFRTRVNEGVEAELEELGGRMYELASAMPGFRSYKDFAAEDGEFVSIVEFETLEQVTAWRDQPDHRAAQELGRSKLFSEYSVSVCEVIRMSRHPAL
jgi:heme-degrading monooxygenase HmoA